MPMRRTTFSLPVYVPESVYRFLISWKKRIARPLAEARRPINNLGEREVEYAWIISNMPSGPGELLDFGNGGSFMALVAAHKRFNVTAVDLTPVEWPYAHPGLRSIKGDILKLSLPEDHFDVIVNCSTIEHVGLAGRYGVTEDFPDGDLEAMRRLGRLMKKDAAMLLTIPVGQDAVFKPLCRIYGSGRLPRLLEGYDIEKEDYWVKNKKNQWIGCDKRDALNFKASAGSWDHLQNAYALGCFILRRTKGRK